VRHKTIHSALFGIAIGDALGVPVEFKSREYLKVNPIVDMIGDGSHHQPAGTWSDDASLTFCLSETLATEFDLQNLANRFVNWYQYAYWTAHDNVFDVGNATSEAIHLLSQGINPILAGGTNELSNGNGSLMRILPIAFYVQNMPIKKRFEIIKDVSSLTHAHIRSVLACFIYIEMALQIMQGKNALEAYNSMKESVNNFLNLQAICSQTEIDKFYRVLGRHSNVDYLILPIYKYAEETIISSGYVVSSLEASFWCLLTSNNYSETVLKAVNLGEDTDTIGAIAGGLAGLLYGFESIPKPWINTIAKEKEIENLCDRLSNKLNLK
jgi:ADP-ribosyl-[dinitrogen reductase] hydrolase